MNSIRRSTFSTFTLILLLTLLATAASGSSSNEPWVDATSPHPADLGGLDWWAAIEPTLPLGTKSAIAPDTTIPQPDGLNWGASATADVNGDGFADVVLAVRNVPCSDCGTIYVFHGSASGVATTASSQIEETTTHRFGSAIYGIGDVNGDSFEDVLVTQRNNRNTAYVFHGSPSGLPSGNAVTVAATTLPPVQRAIALGDVDGDLYGDLAIQVQYRPMCGCREVAVSRVFVYHGSASGLDTGGRTQIDYPDLASMCTCPAIGGNSCSIRVCGFGDGITAGDFDNDGQTDLALTALGYDKNGRVYIYQGTGSGFGTTQSQTFEVPAGERPNTAAAGDFDGDSFADLAIGSSRLETVRILAGSSGGLTGTAAITLTAPLDALGGSGRFASKTLATDLDRDGLDDLLVNAFDFSPEGINRAGRLYTFSGSPSGLPSTPTHILEGSTANERFGRSFAPADFDGDLAEDLLIVTLGQAHIYPGGSEDDADEVAYGGLDEGSGTAVSLGDGLDGTLAGGATWGPGQEGSGLELDGTGYAEFEDTGDGWPLDLEDALTLALWIRPDDLGGNQVLLSKDEAYEIEFGKNGESVWNVRLNNEVQGQADSAIVEGLWQHLTVTWDGDTVRYYTNGQPDGSQSFSGPLDTNDSNVGLGARPAPIANGGPTFFFHGAMDEVRIYQRALSDDEVATLFASKLNDITPPTLSNGAPDGPLSAGTTTATLAITSDEDATCRFSPSGENSWNDLESTFSTTGGTTHGEPLTGLTDDTIHHYFVLCRDALGNTNTALTEIAFTVGDSDVLDGLAAYWTLDENSGCDALDATTQHDGELGGDCAGGNAPQWTPGVRGSGLAFDGDDEVRVAASAELNSPSGVTLSAWIQHGPSDWAAVLDKRDSGEDGYNLYLSNLGQPVMRINSIKVNSAETVDDGQWHHLAVSYDGNAVRIYIDGEESTFVHIGSHTLDTTADLFLGRNFASTDFSFAGTLDEVTVHTRALNPLEVFDLYWSTRP